MFVYGKQVCLYVLERHKELIEEVYLGKEIPSKLFKHFALLNKPIIKPDAKKMQSLAKGGNHQGFLLKVQEILPNKSLFLQDYSRIMVLVGVTDVGNIGSIFRSACAFGIDCVVCTNSFNQSGVARSSSGALFDVPFVWREDILSLANELKMSGFSLFGSSANGENIDNLTIDSRKWAIFLGSEGYGLSNKVANKMDRMLSIKIKNFDSLNVAVAAGILMYRMVK